MPAYGLDATYSIGRELTGVGVYSRRILDGLARQHPDQRFRAYYRPHRFLKSWSAPHARNLGRHLLLEPCGSGGLKLFHGLNQRLPRAMKAPCVVTFHDLFVLTGEYSTPEFQQRFAIQAREAAERAALILCVSRFTAAQVEELLRVPPARLRVVPHGTDPRPDPPPLDARERLILHVGALQTRKNLARLVEAFAATPRGWKLLLAGGDGYGAAEVHAAIARSPRRADIATPGYVPLADLEQAYRRASIFAFPSLDEGFGIPVLEAMAWGVPVLTSNRSALPEAAGGAALLINPTDETELADALRNLCLDEDKRRRMREAGLSRVLNATWDQAVEATWRAYASIA